jgi:hypothetical protein
MQGVPFEVNTPEHHTDGELALGGVGVVAAIRVALKDPN